MREEREQVSGYHLRSPAAFLFTLSVTLCLLSNSPVGGDVTSGCPALGCLPSGTFALSSDVPIVSGNKAVGVKWAINVTASSASGQLRWTEEGFAPYPPLLGCVSSQDAVICSTRSGYVSMDEETGKVWWRYDNLTSPSLPILDVYGDAIGTDGKHLVKIDANGQVEKPVIKIYYDMNPMYSIKLANDNLFLMASYVDGHLITYATNGIVEASLLIREEVGGVNGSFLPVAQPVISGKRAYLLMQFVPDHAQSQKSQTKGASSRNLLRLFAVDLWARIADRISPVWSYNLGHKMAECGQQRARFQPGSLAINGSVLVHNTTVYVSLGPEFQSCDGAFRRANQGTLWAFTDEGAIPQLLFKVAAPLSTLSMYDVSLPDAVPQELKETSRTPQTHPTSSRSNPPRTGRKDPARRFQHRSTGTGTPDSSMLNPYPVLWATTSTSITAFDALKGSLLVIIDVTRLLNMTCQITSFVMVARDQKASAERLVFAVSTNPSKTGSTRGRDTDLGVPYMVAVSVPRGESKLEEDVQILWKVRGPAGSQVLGQIANILYMPPAPHGAPGPRSLQQHAEKRHASEASDVEILLVGSALSRTDQFLFAIGHV